MSQPDTSALIRIGHGTVQCRFCQTIYDTSWVDVSDYVPPVGDGCEHCMDGDAEDELDVSM
jgi:hypothetical protein